jgi:hypothetical protein
MEGFNSGVKGLTQNSTTNGSTPVDKTNIWFGLRMKKLLLTKAVEQCMNIMAGCQVMDMGLVNTLTSQHPTELVPGFCLRGKVAKA